MICDHYLGLELSTIPLPFPEFYQIVEKALTQFICFIQTFLSGSIHHSFFSYSGEFGVRMINSQQNFMRMLGLSLILKKG